MPERIETLFNLLAQFTGGRGGIDHVIVNFGIAAMFWAILLAVAAAKHRENRQPREQLLIVGFSFGLARELLMLTMAVAVALGFADNDRLHVVFPPLEHALSNIAQIVVAAAFMLYLTNEKAITQRFMSMGIGAIVLVYLATFWWWAEYITANPTAKFGQVWCDWLFRIVASLILLYPIVFLWKRASGRIRTAVVIALSFFFLFEFLKIPDMALGEKYESIFAPIRHFLYIAAIPLLGYVYVREQADELGAAFDTLESKVDERTQELTSALHQVEIEVSKKEQTANEMEAFAYSVAHDLRAPLRSMEGFAEALLEDHGGALDTTGRDYLDRISSSATRMGSLIDDLLNYTRLGGGEMAFGSVAIGDVLALVKHNLAADIEASGAEVRIQQNLPVVEGHALTLELVFQNLLSNAMKFNAPGTKPIVEVSGSVDGDNCRIAVKDNGIGIDPEYQEQIFQIFERLQASEDYPGTGIGLAVVQKGVQLHGGSVSVDSKMGEGTTFNIVLPRTQSTLSSD